MSKWLKGCLVGLVLFAILFGLGLREMMKRADGPPPSVSINAPASRVFASLATGDSISNWMFGDDSVPKFMPGGKTVTVSRRGRFVAGDTIIGRYRRQIGGKMTRVTWIVTEVVPDKLLALQMVDEGSGTVMGTRRDSLISSGDSTRVVSNIRAIDLAAPRGQSPPTASKRDTAIDRWFERMILSMIKLGVQFELDHLKSRIEGHR